MGSGTSSGKQTLASKATLQAGDKVLKAEIKAASNNGMYSGYESLYDLYGERLERVAKAYGLDVKYDENAESYPFSTSQGEYASYEIMDQIEAQQKKLGRQKAKIK